MKRFISILLSGLVVFAFTSCGEGQSYGKANNAVPNPVFFIPPGPSDYKFTYKDTTPLEGEITEFHQRRQKYDAELGDFVFDVDVKDETVRVEYRGHGNNKYYLLDGEKYVEIVNPDPDNTPFFSYIGWTFDRRFFFEYASTDSGGKLYKNTNIDSTEVFIYAPTPEREMLLVRHDSPLADPGGYRIEYFGLVVFAGYGFDKANAYASILDAHTTGVNAKRVDPEILYHISYGLTSLTFECKRIPGLRYSIYLMWDEELTYVYCRADNSLVAFDFGESFRDIFYNATNE